MPAPTESDGQEHFGEEDAHYRRFYVEQRELRYGFAAQMLRLVQEFQPAGRLLDIGCGLGFFLDYAGRRGYRCVGIDTSAAATRFAREELHLDAIAADFMDACFSPSEAFDVVTANHVLEHISQPVPFLEKARRLLKPGGILVSASPNFGGLLPRVLTRRWYGLQPSQHVWQFTPESYKALFQKAGFRIERTEIGSMHYAPGSKWKETVIFCLAKLATAIGRGDNLVMVARGSHG
jgi:2-polyprenyl-3-methyl-5-hydroxy-6-metoxy-1,4-benzoquinol methylase